MSAPLLVMQFRGEEAEAHRVDVRNLGQSLVGLDQILNFGLMTIDAGRPPKRGERFPLVVQAAEPRPGSFEILVWLAEGSWALPVVQDIIVSRSADICWHWVSGVLQRMGGRENDSTNNISQLIEILGRELTHRHLETLEWQKLVRPSRSLVAPIGYSCDRILFPKGDETTEIDMPMAEAIRSKNRLEVGDMEEMKVRVDGFTHHNRQLKVVHPAEPGRFITAHVRDPIFDSTPNVYIRAAVEKRFLRVRAKATRKEDRIQSLYIMDAQLVENDDQ